YRFTSLRHFLARHSIRRAAGMASNQIHIGHTDFPLSSCTLEAVPIIREVLAEVHASTFKDASDLGLPPADGFCDLGFRSPANDVKQERSTPFSRHLVK